MRIRTRPSDGRTRIRVYHDGRERYVYIYRLAAVAWDLLDGLGDDRIIHHINGHPMDNRESNLEAHAADEHPRREDGRIR